MGINLIQEDLNRAEKALNAIQKNAGNKDNVLRAVYDYHRWKEHKKNESEKTCDWCGKSGGSIKVLHDQCYEDIMNGAGMI